MSSETLIRFKSPTAIEAAVARERRYQDRKYGAPTQRALTIAEYQEIAFGELSESIKAMHPNDQELHSKLDWVSFALSQRNLAAARKASAAEGDEENALRELLQVAAVAVACFDRHGVVER